MPRSSEVYQRLRFYMGNCWRFMSMPWLGGMVSPEQATTIFACSFGNDGWHHLRKTLEEYDSEPGIDYKETTLYRYLTQFVPVSTSFLSNSGKNENLPLFVYPWGTFRKHELTTSKNPWQSRFCGPSTDDFVREEFMKTIRMYKEIRQQGYQPWKYGHTFIGGTFLERDDGDRRFVVLQGNHRMAILAHLGYQKIAVRNVPGFKKSIRNNNIKCWPVINNDGCSLNHAQEIFDSFFTKNGHHVSALLAQGSTE